MVERETKRLLKCLRTDNGGEYASKQFRGYCLKHDIRHEKIVIVTLQYNGVAKIMNHIIVKKMRSMMKVAQLSESF